MPLLHVPTCARHCLTAAAVLCCFVQPAFAQLNLTARRALVVNPPRAALGQAVTLSVQGAAPNAQYRYVAKVTEMFGGRPIHASCPTTINIGSGARVTWQPRSGVYRLTAYGPAGQETDTLSLAYTVAPRAVMLATSQTPAGSAGVTLVLRTDDLGPGHHYEWWMQYSRAVTDAAGRVSHVLSQPWAAHTTSHFATHPTPVPSSATIKATVSIHRGDPCDIIAAGTKGS
jgi:hypothetical protein